MKEMVDIAMYSSGPGEKKKKMKVEVPAPALAGGGTLINHSYLRFLIFKPWTLKLSLVYLFLQFL